MRLSSFEKYFYFIIVIDNVFIYINPMLKMITHPIVACCLIIYYKLLSSESNPLVVTALLFSLVGGVFLLFDHPIYFKIGTSFFMIVHLLYSYIYRRNLGSIDFEKLLLSTGIVTSMIVFNSIFLPNANDIKWYVFTYSCVLALMTCLAIFQNISLKITLGAFIFAASNIALGLNRFAIPSVAIPFFVSISYVAAQLLIIKGLSRK